MSFTNIDPQELQNFDSDQWWNREGIFKTLHDINPLRLAFITRHVQLTNQRILDIGCGGGILSESLAQQGGQVTGIDMSANALNVAKTHAATAQLTIDYQQITAEELATTQAGHYDIITCMELLEHVPNPQSIITACARLLKPGGHAFFSTINRNLKAYALAILGAEYLLKLLPKGLHQYAKFIRPAELAAWLRNADFTLLQMAGISYNPFTKNYQLSTNIAVNYLLHCQTAI